MTWKKTKIKNASGRTITVWKNEKGQISYSNPKAAKTALKISGIDKGLSGIRDIASFTRASLNVDSGSRPGQFLGGPLPKKIETKSKQLLIDEEKEKSLNPKNYKQWSETEEGKAFIQKELAIQEAVEQDKKEDFAYKASKGQLNIPKTNYVQTPSSTGKDETDEKGGLPISETVTINKKNPAAKSEYPEGDAVIPIGKKYPTTIGGKKTSPIQKKLLDAGHDPKRLRDLMKIYKDRYKSKRGW